MKRSEVDLTSCSFDEFVTFLFAKEVLDSEIEPGKREPWDWTTDVTFVPEQICRYYTQLFRQPEFLAELFTKAQLEQGFWAIEGPNLDCSARNLILENIELPVEIRAECIMSMFELFKRLFAHESLDTSVSMWWDSLCYDWHCGNRNRDRGGEDLHLQNIFFETLSKILFLDSDTCQGAALHGLGHLHHPQTGELIDRYLRERPSLAKEWKEYAVAAAKFEVM
jgi:hypothetical protein